MSQRAEQITQILRQQLNPEHLLVENESYKHHVPKGAETHFKVFIVSHEFTGQSLVQRQRRVNELLAEVFANGLHALAQKTMSPAEWEQAGKPLQFATPECSGHPKTVR